MTVTMMVNSPWTSRPEWLDTWLKIPFYDKNKCEEHSKYFTIFCIICMGKPYCERCWNLKYLQQHKAHSDLILQVCASSRRAAIEVEKIRRFYDISRIQRYIINDNPIVYLNPKTKSVSEDMKVHPKCKICSRNLMDHAYSFCSIACKSRSMESDIVTTRGSEYKRMRKRKRKGIPRRAPLK